MKKGFTLVEVLVTTIMVGAISIGFYGLWHTASNTYYMDTNFLELQQQARNGLDRMVRELRQASAASVVVTSSSPSSYKVVFNTPTSAGVQYYLLAVPFDINSPYLIRKASNGNTTKIADKIIYLKFTFNTPALTIEIHAGKTFFRMMSFPLIEGVTLRNA